MEKHFDLIVDKLYTEAEKGYKSSKDIAFLREIKILRNPENDFEVVRESFHKKYKGMHNVIISYANAYKDGIPLIVLAYISGEINFYPTAFIDTFAKELFVIAEKALRKKK